jgi:ABC-type transport system involved in multi-copper enzyme maturation permease subunit
MSAPKAPAADGTEERVSEARANERRGKLGGFQRAGGAKQALFAHVLRAEWTKFRTVRGWVIGMIIAALVTVGIALLDHSECGGQVTPGQAPKVGVGCSVPIGPSGAAVSDSFYFVHRPLAGHGSITARVTSLTLPGATGPARLQPWSKAGIIIKASTRPGSAYAAMLVTPGHGVRMQYDYTGDLAGLPGAVSPATPRWLRLTRSGAVITGYDSRDGTHWTRVAAVHLAGLPTTAQAGLFAASPGTAIAGSQSLTGSSASGAVTLAAARFDYVTLGGSGSHGWAGTAVGGGAPGAGFHQAGGAVTVTGTGDIAPYVAAANGGTGTPIEQTLTGVFGALIAVIVVAAMFIAAEYRRGLIRITFAASPARAQVLAAKAAVAGAVTFVAGLAGAAGAVVFGTALLRSNGNFILPVSALTEVRVLAGTAALLAVVAVLAVAVGAILRSGAAAVTVLIAGIVLPYLLAIALPVLPASAADWLLRVTPVAGFAIEQTVQRYAQVAASYTPKTGYYPLPPWAGFAVLCAWAALAFGLAVVLLRRRDA